MKILNSNFQKISKDNKDRFEILQKEFHTQDTALKTMIGDVRHKSEVDLANSEERSLMLIDKYFQKIKFSKGMGESEDLIKSLGGTGGLSSVELDKMIETAKEELKKFIE